jgi:hypothetical protein
MRLLLNQKNTRGYLLEVKFMHELVERMLSEAEAGPDAVAADVAFKLTPQEKQLVQASDIRTHMNVFKRIFVDYVKRVASKDMNLAKTLSAKIKDSDWFTKFAGVLKSTSYDGAVPSYA